MIDLQSGNEKIWIASNFNFFTWGVLEMCNLEGDRGGEEGLGMGF